MNKETITVDDYTYLIDGDNPFGFYLIHRQGGAGGLPLAMQGKFTSFDKARQAITLYHKTTKPEVRPVKRKGNSAHGTSTRSGDPE